MTERDRATWGRGDGGPQNESDRRRVEKERLVVRQRKVGAGLRPGECTIWRGQGFKGRSRDGRWIVDATVQVVDGRVAGFGELHVVPFPSGSALAPIVTTSALRDLPMAEWLQSVRLNLSVMAQVRELQVLDEDPALAERLRALASSVSSRPGRPGYDPAFFCYVSLEYLRGRQLGETLDAFAERLTGLLQREYEIPRGTLKDWLRQAERLEFLTKSESRTGRSPGPALAQVLTEGTI